LDSILEKKDRERRERRRAVQFHVRVRDSRCDQQQDAMLELPANYVVPMSVGAAG
jgi:hypothetical protein